VPRVRPAARRSALAPRDTNATNNCRGAQLYTYVEHLTLTRTEPKKNDQVPLLLMTLSTGCRRLG